jgi:hypothetical protein
MARRNLLAPQANAENDIEDMEYNLLRKAGSISGQYLLVTMLHGHCNSDMDYHRT